LVIYIIVKLSGGMGVIFRVGEKLLELDIFRAGKALGLEMESLSIEHFLLGMETI